MRYGESCGSCRVESLVGTCNKCEQLESVECRSYSKISESAHASRKHVLRKYLGKRVGQILSACDFCLAAPSTIHTSPKCRCSISGRFSDLHSFNSLETTASVGLYCTVERFHHRQPPYPQLCPPRCTCAVPAIMSMSLGYADGGESLGRLSERQLAELHKELPRFWGGHNPDTESLEGIPVYNFLEQQAMNAMNGSVYHRNHSSESA